MKHVPFCAWPKPHDDIEGEKTQISHNLVDYNWYTTIKYA